jgi:hypothetical protein
LFEPVIERWTPAKGDRFYYLTLCGDLVHNLNRYASD